MTFIDIYQYLVRFIDIYLSMPPDTGYFACSSFEAAVEVMLRRGLSGLLSERASLFVFDQGFVAGTLGEREGGSMIG